MLIEATDGAKEVRLKERAKAKVAKEKQKSSRTIASHDASLRLRFEENHVSAVICFSGICRRSQ